MAIFVPYLICALFIAMLYGIMRLLLFLSNLSARRSVYQSGIYTDKTVHTLLLAGFGKNNLFSEKFLPRKTEHGVTYEKYDHILILQSAVVIITICTVDGKIQNTDTEENWSCRIKTKAGTERELTFENPISAGKNKKEALEFIFQKLKFRVPIEHIVIFPSRRVRFSLPRQKEVMSPPEAMRTLTKFNRTKRFSKEQKKLLKQILKHRSLTESQVAAKKRKTRQR